MLLASPDEPHHISQFHDRHAATRSTRICRILRINRLQIQQRLGLETLSARCQEPSHRAAYQRRFHADVGAQMLIQAQNLLRPCPSGAQQICNTPQHGVTTPIRTPPDAADVLHSRDHTVRSAARADHRTQKKLINRTADYQTKTVASSVGQHTRFSVRLMNLCCFTHERTRATTRVEAFMFATKSAPFPTIGDTSAGLPQPAA